MRRFVLFAAVLLFSWSAFGERTSEIRNWTAPPHWSVPQSAPEGSRDRSGRQGLASGRHALAVTTYPPLPFIPVMPCRIADTRGNGFTGNYGPPSMAGGASRNFTIAGQCGIPAGVLAVSFNFTVWGTTSYGDLNVYPAGGTRPVVSTLNWNPGILALANAAVVPMGTGGSAGQITAVNESATPIDLFIDVNGYYAIVQPTAETFQITTSAQQAIVGVSTNSPFAYGVSGTAQNGTYGIGVFGQGTASGINGSSVNGYGSVGVSINGVGAYGSSDTTIGVSGESYGANGVGVVGEATGSATGVIGRCNVGGGTGVGVLGQGGDRGVWGQGGLYGTYGSAVSGFGAVGTSEGSGGVFGLVSFGGTGTAGVLGKDNIGYSSSYPSGLPSAGVRGAGIAGVMGLSNRADGYGVGGIAVGAATWGVFAFGNLGASGTKPFVEPHPTDASKEIRYVALEGPEAGTYFRGTSQTRGGIAVVSVPETFRIVTHDEGLTVQVTATGRARIWVESENLHEIVIRSDEDVKFHYHVNGVRRAFRNWQVVSDSVDFRPSAQDQKIPTYLPEEAKNRLIANGTYNADGTVNMNTAERLGWAQTWREEAAAASAKAATRPASQGAP